MATSVDVVVCLPHDGFHSNRRYYQIFKRRASLPYAHQ